MPPVDTPVGERVHFEKCDVVEPVGGSRGSKAFAKVAPMLRVDAEGVATFDGAPFMTSKGPCICNIPLGIIS